MLPHFHLPLHHSKEKLFFWCSLCHDKLDIHSRTVLLERSIDVSEVIWNFAFVLSVVASRGWKLGKAEREHHLHLSPSWSMVTVRGCLQWEVVRWDTGHINTLVQILLPTLDTLSRYASPWVPFSCLGHAVRTAMGRTVTYCRAYNLITKSFGSDGIYLVCLVISPFSPEALDKFAHLYKVQSTQTSNHQQCDKTAEIINIPNSILVIINTYCVFETCANVLIFKTLTLMLLGGKSSVSNGAACLSVWLLLCNHRNICGRVKAEVQPPVQESNII